MRKMGIDYGEKRIGVALSNEDGTMAFPHSVLKNEPAFLDALVALIEEKEVGEIVIGHSLDRENNPNSVQEAINELVTDLTLQTGLPVHLEPEQYTSQAAKRIQGKNAMIDASAAALILDSFITRSK